MSVIIFFLGFALITNVVSERAKELNLCNDDDDCEVVIANEYCHMIQPQVTNAIKGVCVPRNCNPAGDCPTLGNPIQGQLSGTCTKSVCSYDSAIHME